MPLLTLRVLPLQMVEGLKVLIALEQTPLEGNVPYQLPSSAVLLALLPKLLNLQSSWDMFARCALLALWSHSITGMIHCTGNLGGGGGGWGCS